MLVLIKEPDLPEKKVPQRREMPRPFILWLVAFYIALYVIRPWEELFPMLGEIHFEKLYAIFLIVMTIISSKKRLYLTFQSLTILLFLGAIEVSVLFAQNSSLAWLKSYPFLTLVIFYFILLKVVRNSNDLIFLLLSYIVTMAVYLSKSQWEFFFHGKHHFRQGVTRLIGIEDTFGGPNWLSLTIVLSLPILFFLWRFRKEIYLTLPKGSKKKLPIFLLFYFFLAMSSIILTNSRSGMVAFLFYFIIVILQVKGIGKKIIFLMLASLFIIGIWVVMPEESKGRFMTMIHPESGPEGSYESAQGRVEGLKAGLSMFERLPITGVGIGNFIPYRIKHIDGVELEAHNLLGQVLGETGLIGAATFLLILGTILLNIIRVNTLSKQQANNKETILLGLAVAFKNSLYLLLFEGFFNHNLLRYNWIWIAAFVQLVLEFSKGHSIVNKDESEQRA